jgi:UPF0716 family protein affecting phage T7 exclusion
MSLVKWTFIGLLVLPAAEIVGFLLVAAWIGWLWAGILFVATSVIGVMALKRSGRRDLTRLAGALRTEGISALHIDSPGVATMLGAVLLIIPGFITDILGGALFVPVLRRWMAAALARGADRDKPRDHKHHRGPQPNVIDLEPGEWHQIVDRSRASRRKSTRRPSKSGTKSGAKSRS